MTNSLKNRRMSNRPGIISLVFPVLVALSSLLSPALAQVKTEAGQPSASVQPRFAGLPSGSLRKAELIRHHKVELASPHKAELKGLRILQFECTLLMKGRDAVAFQVQGPKLPVAVLAKFKEMQAGDTVFFDDIRVSRTGESQTVNLGGLAFKIVE